MLDSGQVTFDSNEDGGLKPCIFKVMLKMLLKLAATDLLGDLSQ